MAIWPILRHPNYSYICHELIDYYQNVRICAVVWVLFTANFRKFYFLPVVWFTVVRQQGVNAHFRLTVQSGYRGCWRNFVLYVKWMFLEYTW